MKTVLITGGTGKFGSVLLRHFSRKGFRVIYTSTSEQKIEEVSCFYSAQNLPVLGFKVDLSSEVGVACLVRQLMDKNILVDCLVNNARSISSLAIEEDGSVLRSNFMAEYLLDVVVPYELTMALVRTPGSLLRNVVNIGSQYGIVAANPSLYVDYERQSPIHYGVAKAALVHLTKELSVRLAKRNVRVNCVAYGGVEGRADESFRARYSSLVPNQRMLSESEIPGPIDFLLSDSSSSMTGQVICADGGWTVW